MFFFLLSSWLIFGPPPAICYAVEARGRACRAARSRDRGSEAIRVGGVPACVCVWMGLLRKTSNARALEAIDSSMADRCSPRVPGDMFGILERHTHTARARQNVTVTVVLLLVLLPPM